MHLENSGLCLRKGNTTNGQILALLLFKVCMGTARTVEHQWLASCRRLASKSIITTTSGYKLTEHARGTPQHTQGAQQI